MPSVSIIVPVFNCEPYLNRCIESILTQTERDLQIILVDDGSTDGSERLCDELAVRDARIVVIHQKNAGVSAARNAGLDAATGEYIGFVDADDYIAAETYETALAAVDDCDMVMWDTVSIWDDGRTEEDTIVLLENSCVLRKTDQKPELLRLMAGSACRCLYRRELLSGVRFPVGIKLSEDRLFNLYAMGKARSLSYLKQGMYFRYMRKGSAVNRYHGDRFEKSLLAMEVAKDAIDRYWNSSYIPVYTRLFIIAGAWSSICEICCKAFPGRNRLEEIQRIVQHRSLEEAFALYQPKNMREKVMKWKASWLLMMIGFLYNIRYKQ